MEKGHVIHVNINEIVPELREAHDQHINESHVRLIFKHPAPLRFDRYKLATLFGKNKRFKLPEPEGIHGESLHIYTFKDEESFKVFDHSLESAEVKKRSAEKWTGKLVVKLRAQYILEKEWGEKGDTPAELIQLLGVKISQEVKDEFHEWHDTFFATRLAHNPHILRLQRYELVTGIDNPDHPFAKRLAEYPTSLSILNFKDDISFRTFQNYPEAALFRQEMNTRWNSDKVKVLMRTEYALFKTWTRKMFS